MYSRHTMKTHYLLFAPHLSLLLALGSMSLGQSPVQPRERGGSAQAPPAPEAAAVPRVDRFGDPLPEGALLRLGTVRFKHPDSASALLLSPDGKNIVSRGSFVVRVWDAANGKLLQNLPVRAGRMDGFFAGQNQLAFEPDGRFYIAGQGEILVFDPATGRQTPLPHNKPS